MIKPTLQVKKNGATTDSTTKTGRFGEAVALKYLLNKGYSLVQRNFYIQGGELDLIMQKNGIIVFVEVKLRSGKNFGTAVEALTFNKKRKLLRAIFTYLQTTSGQARWQLDLVAIDYKKHSHTAEVQHFLNILEA